MTEHAVAIAGAGPTGLMLAGELALAGADCVVVERRDDQEVDGSRAGGLLPRTLEVLDQRGIADRFVAEGTVTGAHGFAHMPLDISDLPTRHNHVLGLWQRHIERILAGWVEELGVPVLRGREVVGLTQDDGGVDVALSGGAGLRAGYLVGCDGGRSAVRRAAGIAFPGSAPTTSWMIAEAEMDGELEAGMRHDRLGSHGLGRLEDGRARVVLTEREVEHDREPGLGDLREALIAVYGTDFGLRRATWISRFTDATRQAAAYRDRRVLLAGDAAHVHPPHGGQGLQTGVQDAVNLGWKLAQVVAGTSPDALLDTYGAERHPVGARVLRNTMAQVLLGRPDERHRALRETMAELLAMDEPRRHVAAMLTGLDIRYDMGDGHPLLGRRIPDLDLVTADGPVRLFTLLHDARPLLLDLGGGADAAVIAGWADRVRSVAAGCERRWELPAVGRVAAPGTVLVRPDGHVAWVGDGTGAGLPEALETWFGPPAATS
jgi:2-polyprenyl-6-methoxyphenol hydroxylase-like FAD-dependent oxidoreductase